MKDCICSCILQKDPLINLTLFYFVVFFSVILNFPKEVIKCITGRSTLDEINKQEPRKQKSIFRIEKLTLEFHNPEIYDGDTYYFDTIFKGRVSIIGYFAKLEGI